MRNHTPTIFIVDHERSARESLTALIQSTGWQPETFASAEEFLVRPTIEGPKCMLLEDTLTDVDGLTVLSRLSAEWSEMPIIMIADHGDVPMMVRAMKAGVVEFLVKPLINDVVLSAVREAVKQSGEVLERESELREIRGRFGSLRKREREVMVLVVGGLLNKQVGARLGISEVTVKAHRGQMMRKMAASSLAELVTMAVRLRLTPPSIWRAAGGRDASAGERAMSSRLDTAYHAM